MEITTIRIPVDSNLAEVYNTASINEQRKVQALLTLWLRECDETGQISLDVLMDTISDRAQARGLTPELLESLLNDNE